MSNALLMFIATSNVPYGCYDWFMRSVCSVRWLYMKLFSVEWISFSKFGYLKTKVIWYFRIGIMFPYVGDFVVYSGVVEDIYKCLNCN